MGPRGHHRSRPAGTRPATLFAILALVAAGCLAAVPRGGIDHVLLYGDSLAHEARGYWVVGTAAPGVLAHTRTYGGTALCDWLPTIRADAATLHPTVVVLTFSGNALTPCTTSADGTPLSGGALVDRYEADLRAAIDAAPTARIVVAGSPVTRPPAPAWSALMDMYRRVAAEHPRVDFVDAGDAVAPGGTYVDRLPCLPHEGPDDGCADGTIAVRARDGAHFCPTTNRPAGGSVPECPVYSSGAWRYASAMSAAVARIRAGLPLTPPAPPGSPTTTAPTTATSVPASTTTTAPTPETTTTAPPQTTTTTPPPDPTTTTTTASS